MAHRAAGADPLSVGDLWERRVQAVDVIGRGARVAAQQLSSVFAHPAELHVVVVLLHLSGVPVVLLAVRGLLSGLPLNALLLLRRRKNSFTLEYCGTVFLYVVVMLLTQCGQLQVPSGAFSMSGSRQTMWYALGQVSHRMISPPCWQTSQ